MKHYICTGGCGMQSEVEGVCDAQFCKKEGQLLTECNCEDGQHEEKVNQDEEGAEYNSYDDKDLGE